MSSKRTKLQERYELRETLGRGGMGIVYKAYDRLMNREVALKTILDVDNPETLAMFYKEWSTLSAMVHPNVINIYDIGEFEDEGAKKPFFVMPLLPGTTLDKLIKEASPRLSVAGVMAIVDQAARGLHAAHEQGLIHRDVKPSNIFVMDDGSVKIIDFGIVRSASANSRTSLKGTLYYMAPEQLSMKPPSPLSDMFALGAVTYEALTRLRPFRGANDGEVIEAIQKHSPPPISELNHEVGFAISQVVHKAMAKQPWHRFFNMREYGDALMKALRNEPLEYFDATKIKPRLERAAKSYEQADYEFASEVLSELEAEGHLDQGIALLRGQVDQAVRQLRIKQMLENARRFYEANEYPLALRKIQEALDLDANDATALSLKAQVERERREKKISEWITLSRQHLENQAFRQAREALENVLQLKPNDTDALSLAAEVGRREKEVAAVREQKAKLYQAAMQAWEQGDVTQALTKLESLLVMDRDNPEADTGRSHTYQGLYNKVHSEHNTLKNSLEEAHRYLSGDNYEAALAICQQYLVKYPNHVLFQSLKFDVEERQRQGLSRVIAETDKRVDEEPDLDRRMAILEEVLKVYPGEPHFMRAIQLVRDKRDLVNSIVTKARFFEERGQFVEALDQWQILKSIHEKQPGLAFEIERVIKRRDTQALHNSKARWVEQTDKYLEGGDYERARKTIQNALLEFPNEAELLELDKLVSKHQERANQATELLGRARQSGDSWTVDQTLTDLREAYKLDPRNSVIRTVLVNTLLEHARQSMEKNPETAETALNEILQLDPGHVPARSQLTQLADHKREEFVAWCLTQARRLQTDGDFAGALAVAGQGLASYPNDPRLLQLQATMSRVQDAAQKSHDAARTQNPASLPKNPAPAKAVPPGPPPVPPQATAPQPESQPILQPPAHLPAAPNVVPPPPPSPQLRMPPPPPGWKGAATEADLTRTEVKVLIPTAARAPSPPGPPPQAKDQKNGKKKTAYAGIALGLGVVVLVLGGVAYLKRNKSVPPPPPVEVVNIKVNLRSTPAGAEINVNGKACTSPCEMELAPGDYRAEAKLANFQTATVPFTIAAGQSSIPDVNLTLLPPASLVTITTDLPDGTVQLDGAQVGQIQGTDFEIAKLTPAQHVIYLESGAFSSKVTVDIAEGAMPKVAGMQTNAMHGFVVSHSGSTAQVYGSLDGAKASLDGKPVGVLNAGGLELKDLSPGSHEVLVESQAGSARATFDTGATGLTAALMSQQNIGVLYIAANQDGVEIYINGEKTKRTTIAGKVRLNLPPKSYVVRVQKVGFVTPPEQTANLPKADAVHLEFRLIAARAALMIHHGVVGSEVFVDGTRIGLVDPSGEFSAAYIEPGRHTVSLKHDRLQTRQSEQVFAVGKTIELEGALQSLMGTLKIEVTPSDARVRVRKLGEQQDQDVRDLTMSLAEGMYTVSASAPRYQDAQTTVRVPAGGLATAQLPLRRVESNAPKVTPPPVATDTAHPLFALDEWLKVGWNRDGNTMTRIGGDNTLAPVDLSKATIQFTVNLIKGKRVEWMAAYRDPKNYELFQFEETYFIRTDVINGKHGKSERVAHGAKIKGYNTFSIKITPQSILTSILRDQQWSSLDDFRPAAGVTAGRFGFHIPGKDQLTLNDFKIAAN